MRALLLLIALILALLAAVYSAFVSNPDVLTSLALGWGGLAAYFAALLVDERFP